MGRYRWQGWVSITVSVIALAGCSGERAEGRSTDTTAVSVAEAEQYPDGFEAVEARPEGEPNEDIAMDYQPNSFDGFQMIALESMDGNDPESGSWLLFTPSPEPQGTEIRVVVGDRFSFGGYVFEITGGELDSYTSYLVWTIS